VVKKIEKKSKTPTAPNLPTKKNKGQPSPPPPPPPPRKKFSDGQRGKVKHWFSPHQ